MLSTSLEKAMEFAKARKIAKVLEIKCPRETCGKTMYAFAEERPGEHLSWLENFKRERHGRHVYCKHCGYGTMSDTESAFVFKNHNVSNRE